jgi:hypothetical protein
MAPHPLPAAADEAGIVKQQDFLQATQVLLYAPIDEHFSLLRV